MTGRCTGTVAQAKMRLHVVVYRGAMADTKRQRVYREEARVLGEIGEVLAHAELPNVTVRLPSTLAQAAVAAWQRDDEDELDPESYEQRVLRHRAGALALIGLAVQEGGRAEGDEVVVDLSPDLIGNALDAADDLPRGVG